VNETSVEINHPTATHQVKITKFIKANILSDKLLLFLLNFISESFSNFAMGNKRCSVASCQSHNSVGTSVFALPKQKDIAEKWMNFIELQNNEKIKVKNVFLCELHFSKSQVVKISRSSSLVPQAVPQFNQVCTTSFVVNFKILFTNFFLSSTVRSTP
jgi:THAP domain